MKKIFYLLKIPFKILSKTFRFLGLLGGVLFVLFSFAVGVSADSPTAGSINSTAYTYLSGVVKSLPVNTDYVLYKSGDYTTTLIYGDLEHSGNSITSSSITEVVYNQRGKNSGNSYYPTVTKSTKNNYTLTVTNDTIYSNLRGFSYIERGAENEIKVLQVSVAVLFLFVVLHDLFSDGWVLIRSKRGG